MTRQIAVLVEGQTEEAFVSRVLQPHIGFERATLVPIVVHTSHAANGVAYRGGGSWSHYRQHLQKLLAQPHWSLVTTMIDYYGYPSDAPGCNCEGSHVQPQCVEGREQAIISEFESRRLLPFVTLHEFETLVIAAAAQQSHVLGSVAAADVFRQLVHEFDGNAELINNGPATAPSKRVARALPEYRKVRDGVAVVEVAISEALASAPRFDRWVRTLAGHER